MNRPSPESNPPAADTESAHGCTLAAMFAQSITRFADRVAVTDESGSELTYRELGDRSNRLAVGLDARGLRRGGRVAVLSAPRPEYVETYLALARLGVTALTLNTRMHVDELAWCLNSGSPDAVIVDGAFGDAAAALRTRCPQIREWICFDGTTDDFTPYSDLQRDEGPSRPNSPHPTTSTTCSTRAGPRADRRAR